MKTRKFYFSLFLLISITTTFSQSYTKSNAPWINSPFDVTGDYLNTLKDFRLFGNVKMIISDKGKDTITFDKNGRVIKDINYNGKGKIMQERILKYETNKIIQTINRYNNRPVYITVFKLDKKRRIIESYEKEKPDIKLIYNYDNKDNLISVKNTEYNSTEFYKYNTENQLMVYKYITKEGEIYSSKKFDYKKYNSNKELIVNSMYEGKKSSFSIIYDKYGNLDKNHYEYDEKGNWTTKFNDYTDEKRVIIYYK